MQRRFHHFSPLSGWPSPLSMAGLALVVPLALSHAPEARAVSYAQSVVSFNAGSGTAGIWTNPSAALGLPSPLTGDTGNPFGVFPNVLSPFSSAFETDEIVQIGEGGHITLELKDAVKPLAGGPEIGVIENVSFIDLAYPTGLVGSPVLSFGEDSAQVELSANGSTWVSLGSIPFNMPANAYTDLTDPYSPTAGATLSDFGKPYVGSVSDFAGLDYAGVVQQLNGSVGGTWIDISAAGLTEVRFIRFSVADDGNAQTQLTLELDSVLVANDAVVNGNGGGNGPVPEPTTLGLLLLAGGPWLALSRAGRRG